MTELIRFGRALGVAALIQSWAGSAAGQGLWVTAYYAGWRQSHLSPDKIDFGAFTHLVHFAAFPRPDGTLDAEVNLLNEANIAATVRAAHEAGRKILFTVGGQSTRQRFESAMSDRYRKAFISNLVAFLRDHGYDGIDVDMEDIVREDEPAYERFIKELRAELDKMSPRPLLTAAVLWDPGLFGRLSSEFDQINIMTYDLAGPYPGWVTWHSGAVYDGGHRFPNGSARLPSVDSQVAEFLGAGVPRSKLGVGVSFYGYVWSGGDVNGPLQVWSATPALKDFPYYAIADAYDLREYDYTNPLYHWDDKVQAAYLSVKGPGEPKFISYDNELTAERKVEYARRKGLGGVIIWELGGGYRDSQTEGRRDLLLQAVKKAAFGLGTIQ